MSLKHIQSLDYLVLLCDDLAAMRKFYEGVLGFAVTLERTNLDRDARWRNAADSSSPHAK